VVERFHPDERQPMLRHPFDGVCKGLPRIIGPASPTLERTDRIPGVGAAFTCVEMPALFGRELEAKRVQRGVVLVA
jgi:hypothetical protein